jgi:hypothetical protein
MLSERARFCAEECPICKSARKGNRTAKWFVKNIDRHICPFCKAYEKETGKKAYGD